MDSEARTAQLVEPIGLSSFTFQEKPAQAQGLMQAWQNSRSQPAKLLMLSLLIMAGLCGLIYNGMQ